jgi:transposase-like protein
MPAFAQVGDFFPNTDCADHGKEQNECQCSIIKFGKTKAGRQRFKCNTCGRTFTETKGTIFYRRRTPDDEIIETLALVAEGSRISSLARVKGHKEDTCQVTIRNGH